MEMIAVDKLISKETSSLEASLIFFIFTNKIKNIENDFLKFE